MKKVRKVRWHGVVRETLKALMKMNTTANAPVTVGGEPIRKVESFVYLESVIDQQGGAD